MAYAIEDVVATNASAPVNEYALFVNGVPYGVAWVEIRDRVVFVQQQTARQANLLCTPTQQSQCRLSDVVASWNKDEGSIRLTVGPCRF